MIDATTKRFAFYVPNPSDYERNENYMKKACSITLSLIMTMCLLCNSISYAGSMELLENTSPATAAVLDNIDYSISILYNNSYHENVLLSGKELTLDLELKNKSSELKMIQYILEVYDSNNNIVESTFCDDKIMAGTTKMITISKNIPQDISIDRAVVYLWDNLTNTEPYTIIGMCPTATDYYGNDFATATLIPDISRLITGTIDYAGDNDYIKFIAPSSGSYIIQCYSITDVIYLIGCLYDENQSLKANSTGNNKYSLTANLTAGQTYYLATIGSSTGDYLVSIQKSDEAQNFNIYNYDIEINGYKQKIMSLCDAAYENEEYALSQEIYNIFEIAYDTDLFLHDVPLLIKSIPKDTPTYDAQVTAYYLTKKVAFEALMATYLSILSEYSGRGTTSIDNEATELSDNSCKRQLSAEFTETEPQVVVIPPLMTAPSEDAESEQNSSPAQDEEEEPTLSSVSISDENDAIGQNAIFAAATASLTIVSTTATSITISATFPVSGAKGNALALYDYNQGERIENWPYLGGIYYVDGTYTISGLVPGGLYTVWICWSTNGGQTYGGDNSIGRSIMIQYNTVENLETQNGTYITATLESDDKALATTVNFSTWLSRMDSVYSTLQDLTGYTPYNGKSIELKSTRKNLSQGHDVDPSFVGAIAGNPALVLRPVFRGLMLRLAGGDWGTAEIHEISHDFDVNDWCFDYEVLADLKLCYVVETLPNCKIYVETMSYFSGNNINSYFQPSYNNSFAKGFYNYYGMTAIMLRIKQSIGWQAFKDTFRYMSNLSVDELNYIYAMPRQDQIGKFNIFITKLKEYSGQDIISKLTTQEINIIQAQYGGTIEYYTAPTINGGGGQTNIHVPAGSFAIRKFTPATTGSYNIFTAPYAGTGVENDTVLEVYADDYFHILLASNDDYGGSKFSRVTMNLQANQNYYIIIKHHGNGVVHADLKVSKAPVTLALPNPVDTQVSGLELSIFKYTPIASGITYFTLSDYNGAPQTTNKDIILDLYRDEALTQRVAAVNYQAGAFPHISANLAQGLTYYLTFAGYLGKPAQARISVNATQAMGINTNRIYMIRNVLSNCAIDIPNSGTTANAIATQYPSHGGANQKYRLIYISNGEYKIEPMCAAGFGMVLSLNGSKQLIIDTDTNTSSKRWCLENLSGGNYRIVNKAYPSEFLSVNGNTATGANIYSSSNTNNGEIWQITPVERIVNVRVLRHASFNDTFGSNASAYASEMFNNAAPAFFNRWGLKFVATQSIPAQTFYVDGCPLSDKYNNACTTSCSYPPDHPNCGSRHKCGLQLYNDVRNNYPTDSTYGLTTCFFTFINSCGSWGGGDHSVVLMDNATGTGTKAYLWNVRRIQHEICHCFGGKHNDPATPCSIEDCIYNGGFDDVYTYDQDSIWCANCEKDFVKNKFQ